MREECRKREGRVKEEGRKARSSLMAARFFAVLASHGWGGWLNDFFVG